MVFQYNSSIAVSFRDTVSAIDLFPRQPAGGIALTGFPVTDAFLKPGDESAGGSDISGCFSFLTKYGVEVMEPLQALFLS